MGAFIDGHASRSKRPMFGAVRVSRRISIVAAAAATLLPHLRGVVSSNRRTIAHWDDSEAALTFASSHWAEQLCAARNQLSGSLPSHPDLAHVRRLESGDGGVGCSAGADPRASGSTTGPNTSAYYESFADAASPALRDSNPSVVVVPGLGIFGFAKDKREARITTEFFLNAIQVMAGANALEDGHVSAEAVPQARFPEQAADFASFHNYVALPRREAFRIEYWALEEAKLQRMPPERELRRKIALVVGAGSGIGREVVLESARRGAHVVAADLNLDRRRGVAAEARVARIARARDVVRVEPRLAREHPLGLERDRAPTSGGSTSSSTRPLCIRPRRPGRRAEQVWAQAMAINVTSNHVLALGGRINLQRRRRCLPAWCSRARPTRWCQAGKRALRCQQGRHQPSDSRVRDWARPQRACQRHRAGHGRRRFVDVPARSGGRIAAEVPIPFDERESTEELRGKLAAFYAQRTITRQPILPEDCASAICWLAGEQSAKTTGHVIPVDGGLPEAFLTMNGRRRVTRGSADRRQIHQLVVRVDVIDVLGRHELMLDEHGRRHRPLVQQVESHRTISGPYFSGKYATEPMRRVFRAAAVRRVPRAKRSDP